jgi:hypothetical protein
MRTALLSLAAALALVTAGCGDADSPEAGSPSPSPTSSSPADGPQCGEVWVAKAPLPEDYRGCYEEDGEFVKADKQMCSFGTEMVTYDNRFYGILGKWVNEVEGTLDTSKVYRKAYNTCTA